MKSNIKKFVFILFASLSLPAFAVPLVQRNCKPDDLTIGAASNAVTPVTCIWQAGDSNMQTTLHSDLSHFKGACTFTPKDPQKNPQDQVLIVLGHKAANIANLKFDDKDKNNFTFDVLNVPPDPDTTNLNIMFFLNSTNFTVGDQLVCTFSALAPVTTTPGSVSPGTTPGSNAPGATPNSVTSGT